MRLIDQYKQLHSTILERAVYIHDFLLTRCALERHLLEYRPYSIGYDTTTLNMRINYDQVMLEHFEPYEDYTQTWYAPLEYIEMSDEDIQKMFLKRVTELYEANKGNRVDTLKYEADLLGYELVKK